MSLPSSISVSLLYNPTHGTMSSLTHTSAGLGKETPSTSETAVGGDAGGNVVAKSDASEQTSKDPSAGTTASSSEPGSAEAAAEKLFEERMEEEYAKREGGA